MLQHGTSAFKRARPWPWVLSLSVIQLTAGCAQPQCACGAYAASAPAPVVEAQTQQVSGESARVQPKDGGTRAEKHPSEAGTTSRVARSESELLSRYEGKSPTRVLKGKATYYGDSLAGHKTANGDVYDPGAFTAAHRTLPFNTVVRVVRLDTQRYVYVRINDRGPFGSADRIIDLSRIAAERLGMLRAGVVKVRVEVLE
ncbi:MAG TPA: septal ring lytic transglycosylase RlpA family protein [Polyangiaceae bacterium]|jgi:rare lipoprotein A|nr:septal ring lytic transglycosylase RlpA family protein [Polyangiaceae bacterium]